MKIQYSLIFALVISTFGFSQTNMDAEAMEKIKNEGLNNSQVESISLQYLKPGQWEPAEKLAVKLYF